ncbi:MAG: M12 family metallo-peptidase, partial [Candidatus Kapaibacterium sp.]
MLILVASLLSILVPSAPMSAQTASQPSAPRVLSWHDVAVARRPGGQAIANGLMLRYTMSASARELLAARSTTRLHDVPLPGDEAVTLELVSAPSVVDATTVFLTQTRDGEVRTTAPRVRCMRGVITGDPGSSVFLSTSAVGLLATITKSDGRRWFLASERTDAGSVVVVQENDLYADWKRVLGCAAPDLPRDFARTHPPRILSNDLLEVELALETDSEFFTAAGSDLEKAQAYAIAMMSLVSDIYEKEIKVRVHVPWFKCWTASPRDPYAAAGNPFTLRDKAIPYWQANRSDVKRDLYHMITSVSYGGGGFGYLSQLCQSPYGMASSSVQVQHTYPTYAFTYDVYIVAHELGHNFNAQHSHSCYFGYPLDTCVVDDAIAGGCLPAGTKTKPNPGSIMSYCGGPNGAAGLGYQMRMTFLPQNIALMRQSAESAACITAPPEPSVVLVSPRGSQSFSVRSPLTIEYLSTRVAAVSFDVSYDEGRSWRQIIGDADPLRGSMQWTPPDTCSNSVMMRVRSTEDSSVSDVTTLPFALYREAPSGLLASYDFAGDYVNSVCGGFDNAIAVNGEVKFVADRFGLKDSAIAVNGAGYLVAPKADLRSPALSV